MAQPSDTPANIKQIYSALRKQKTQNAIINQSRSKAK